MRSWSVPALAISLLTMPTASRAERNPLADLLGRNPALRAVADDPAHRVQIHYTQIDREGSGAPRFTTHSYAAHGAPYFYPASTVKLPVALLALEKCRRLGIPLDATMVTGTATDWQTPAIEVGGILRYVRKILLVSDNDAHNRLLEFMGVDAIAGALAARGDTESRIFHRLSVAREPDHYRYANPVEFWVDGERVHSQEALVSERTFLVPEPIPVGIAYLEGGQTVDRPKDFAGLNAFPLPRQQAVLRAFLFPDSVPAAERFDLGPDGRAAVLAAMAMVPRESSDPVYPASAFPDRYTKFLLPEQDGLLSYGKSGLAYGFAIDNAYIVDPAGGAEFLLAAVVYANANGVLNDNTYEYDTVALPFLRGLGAAVLDHERQRPRGASGIPPLR